MNVVETIEEVIVKTQLRWFGHVARRLDMSNAIALLIAIATS